MYSPWCEMLYVFCRNQYTDNDASFEYDLFAVNSLLSGITFRMKAVCVFADHFSSPVHPALSGCITIFRERGRGGPPPIALGPPINRSCCEYRRHGYSPLPGFSLPAHQRLNMAEVYLISSLTCTVQTPGIIFICLLVLLLSSAKTS